MAAESQTTVEEVPLLSLEKVGKTYRTRRGESVAAVREVTLAIQEGEFISLLGPSGCGKSTLLHVIAGILPPSVGKLLIRDEDRPINAREFGMVFQDPVLFPWRTIRKNVEMPAEVLGIPRAEYEPRAQELLELVGLANFGNAYPHELSGGMQQRASIARAMIHDPLLMLMDEPFGALDAMTREQLNIELHRIHQAQGKTVAFVTHSIAEAVLLSDRVVIMGARPSRVQAVFDIDLPQNRDLNVMGMEKFSETVRAIRKVMNES